MPTPSSPEEWKEYAQSLADIPGQSILSTVLHEGDPDNVVSYTLRGIYVNLADVDNKPGETGYEGYRLADQKYIFADVIDVSDVMADIPINFYETRVHGFTFGKAIICARVITCSRPIDLNMCAGNVLVLSGSFLDNPVNLVWTTSEKKDPKYRKSVSLTSTMKPRGAGFGVCLRFTIPTGQDFNDAEIIPISDPSALPEFDDVARSAYRRHLQTELRVAKALSWSNQSMALSVASWIENATHNDDTGSDLYLEAVNLRQQVAADTLTGSGVSYAPVLNVQTYMSTLKLGVSAASDFEEQFHRFQDRELSLQDQLDAWQTIGEQAQNAIAMHQNLATGALQKYKDASNVDQAALKQFKADKANLEEKRAAFEAGIEKYEEEQWFRALKATIGIGVAIGEIFAGDPAAAFGIPGKIGELDDAIENLRAISDSPDTLVKYADVADLQDWLRAESKLYTTVGEIVQQLEDDPTSTISAQAYGYDDVSEIAALTAWDEWVLQSDLQMEFAVKQDIDGAREYRQALREHAMSGKLLAQAQAQTVKAGQEFLKAQLQVTASQRDFQDIEDLRAKYNGEKELAEEAAVKMYDRLMGLKLILIYKMQTLLWAYKYYTLDDINVQLDAQKSIGGFKADMFTLQDNLDKVDEKFPDSEFSFPVPPYPMLGLSAIVESLKNTYKASFTFIPDSTSDHRNRELAGPFTDGSHYRISSVEVGLIGAVPKTPNDNGTVTKLRISTSGIYYDFKAAGSEMFCFTSAPLSRVFEYAMTDTGAVSQIFVEADFTNSDATHAEPTAFTQWTIEIVNPEDFDLSGLSDIQLTWKGHAWLYT
ncbi:hypothetical protein BDV12DRAFT_172387 [Aspergillus spectabilis]